MISPPRSAAARVAAPQGANFGFAALRESWGGPAENLPRGFYLATCLINGLMAQRILGSQVR